MRAARIPALALAGAALIAASAAAQAPVVNAREIDAHLRFLSSDLLEGRAPATRGGRLAAEYIAAQLRAYGVEPAAGGGSYFQRVPIDIVAAEPQTMNVMASGRATATLRYPDDVVIWAGAAARNDDGRPGTQSIDARSEIVFVGYGAAAPEFRWDDFKGVDLHGKVLMVLVNDPPAPASEPNLFGGRAMTYYGRWTYKFEEAERRGAAGMLIVHTTERAGYPWHTVVGSWAKEQRMLPRDPALPQPLGFRGWITDSAATTLLGQAGLNLADLRRQAATRDFRPVPTGIMLDVHFRSTVQHLESENVVGVVRGSDPRLRDQAVALSAHWDHLGIGPAVNGDSIYNGAEDNASGVADLLAAAHAAAARPAPKRSLLFVFVTAEESGLLGSAAFAQNPPMPIGSIVANLNVDGGNVLGRTRDFRLLGDTKSTLGPLFSRMIAPRGWRVSPDEHPERGAFYRSDHFSFARAGVPSVSIGAGNDFVGKPAGWGLRQQEDYTEHHYHQPSDEYHADFDLTGAVQLSTAVLDFATQIANAATLPQWNRDAEFASVRPPR
ncbi:MAG TPA: M28 family peptidase [Longimicrobium sp.]|jgi:Zn-dependent M28 family amino/carboxypeptidase|nr:M28 family peptidase [Longimicrobium sp.]